MSSPIREAHGVLHALQKLQGNLAFPKSVLRATIPLLLARFSRKREWYIKQGDIEEYTMTMSNRLANACRATQQGCVKSPSALWVRELPWRQAVPSVALESEPPTKANHAKRKTEYMYGFNRELRQAWRAVCD